jgi:hypothetical protein
MKCPEFAQLLEWLEDRLEPASRTGIAAHVRECSACSEKKAWIERTLPAMKNAPSLYDAPEATILKAVALQAEKGQTVAEWILAKLEFDSWASPAVAGSRAEDRGARQCIYASGAYRVHLLLEADGKRGRVIGQVVSSLEPGTAGNYLVELSDSKKTIDRTMTNSQGEFLLKAPRNKKLQLKIHGDSESVLISFRG